MRLSLPFLLLPYLCLSQQTLDADEFFERGLSKFDQIEKPVRESVNFPWIEKYEVRTESRDFDWAQQEYTFRVSPSTPRIRNAQKAYYDELRNSPDFEGQEIYCDYVYSLHLDWISLFALNEKISDLNKLAVALNDKKTIYERMAGTYDFDVQALVKLQTELSDLEISIHNKNLEWDYLLNKHNIQNKEIDFDNFITIEVIDAYLSESIITSNESEAVDMETAYKEQLLTKEIELELSEKNKIIDFAQVKYNGPHSDLLQERLSVGLGFQLSTSGSQKLKMQELQIKREELNHKSARRLQEKKSKLFTLANKIQTDIQAFYYFKRTMEEERIQLKNLSVNIVQKEGVSPLFLLDVDERHLSMKLKSGDRKEAMLKDYLKYLKQTHKMCQPDFVNYLNQ